MKKGGYQIIDLENRSFTAPANSKYGGVYELIEGTTKVILISGLNIGGVEQRDFFASPILVGTSYQFPVIGLDGTEYTLTVADTDVVSLATK